MEKDASQAVPGKTAFRVLIALGIAHCMNDTLQSLISASYPILKDDLVLSFGQIGLITLVYQLAASMFQPLFGLYFDKRPSPWSLPLGMSFILLGIILLAYASTLGLVLLSVFLVGLGSSVFHPEASRLTSMASGGRRGLAQSVFQVGGNFGSSLGPLLAALLIAPYGRQNLSLFALLALSAIVLMVPIARWYQRYLAHIKREEQAAPAHVKMPLPRKQTVFTIAILLILIFSKYIYMASLTSYYTFYLIEKFDATVQHSQYFLFLFLFATAAGTLLGGPIGDRIGRKYVIWGSILGAAPFSLLMPHMGLFWTAVFSFCVGLILSSAFPAILVYAQELLPYKLGLISGLFFGFAFGVAGVASAVLGYMADHYGIEAVYNVCAYMPLLGLVACLLPDIRRKKG
ncbi:MFS transporter [Parabacteroides sp. Marseille-P3160]|uniref:MFS transporter n=1 Tax=Parabacteroides sp. Marseille-P3160 TaxID=1917887 RepID=UPI0009BB5B00|nr:MFS transporter [Parabacteroides sp. Marseille-P3160]